MIPDRNQTGEAAYNGTRSRNAPGAFVLHEAGRGGICMEWTMKDMIPGQKAMVRKILSEESLKQRFWDIGLTEGTVIECVGESPSGDSAAYRIRGAVIAVRRTDGADVLISEPERTKEEIPEVESRTVVLAGNPNVGKSTVFNSLTHERQHTGNWPGKTVGCARGSFRSGRYRYTLVDIPGTYSLASGLGEELSACRVLCSAEMDAVLVVCDATCLERNLILVFQVLEITDRVLVCVNLMDEADRRGIQIDCKRLEERLGVPVAETVAHKRKTMKKLVERLDEIVGEWPEALKNQKGKPLRAFYGPEAEHAVGLVDRALQEAFPQRQGLRWMSIRLLEEAELPEDLRKASEPARKEAWEYLTEKGIDREKFRKLVAEGTARAARTLCDEAVIQKKGTADARDRRIDRLVTGKLGYPLMALLLLVIFWITIVGANIPSEWLLGMFREGQGILTAGLSCAGTPKWLQDLLVLGIYRVVTWVLSVMLPPMAVFFPLFALLEDSGYLPRIAYNLDRPFRCCNACGKQALTMCMGFGCNAVGITGCRIIDSSRERLMAILTNCFVPCNGRFPALLTMTSLFFAAGGSGRGGESVKTAIFLTGIILFGIGMTFLTSWLLSVTILKGEPSAFTLELPPYRRPQIGRVLIHAVLDRTVYVLGRALVSAAPAGALLWAAANVSVRGCSLLQYCAGILNPFAAVFGMDGAILLAFLLGLPANEIVLPMILMIYTSGRSLVPIENLSQVHQILTANGWTRMTALCTMLFFLMHWPCATTLLTIRRETGSVKWTVLAAVLPASAGLLVCLTVRMTGSLLGVG